MTKTERNRRWWTPEEDEKLSERWGEYTLESLARQFGRTTYAVKKRAQRLKLGRRVNSVDGVALRTICELLYGNGSAREYKKLKKHRLPYFTVETEKKTFYLVNIDKFWKWARKHTDVVDITRIEPLALGKEPAWVRDLRRKKSYENYMERWGQVQA